MIQNSEILIFGICSGTSYRISIFYLNPKICISLVLKIYSQSHNLKFSEYFFKNNKLQMDTNF